MNLLSRNNIMLIAVLAILFMVYQMRPKRKPMMANGNGNGNGNG